jgi:hypothetical protein
MLFFNVEHDSTWFQTRKMAINTIFQAIKNFIFIVYLVLKYF